jgi:ketoreductase RED2
MTDDKIAGKAVLVTGSSSGIGEAIARRFAGLGAKVVVNSAQSVSAGEQLAQSLPDAIYLQADISDAVDCQGLIDATIEKYGRLDLLVNNAGTTEVIPHEDFDAATDEIWERILGVNVIGTWRLSKLAVPFLREGGGGSIINISSIAGVRPIGSSIPYSVSKAAINHMTELMAKVVGPEVRINAVAPGLIDTPWTAGWEEMHTSVEKVAPLQRSGLPDDIAEACIGLARADYVTGQVLVVDGGLTSVM